MFLVTIFWSRPINYASRIFIYNEKGSDYVEIKKNSRQIPSASYVIKEKNYCDILYAWLQCNSERESLNSARRRIEKKRIKWVALEREFTREMVDGTQEKLMTRKTIAKYFEHLLAQGLVVEGQDDYYYLTVLDPSEANLIEFVTLSKLTNVLQINSLNIYVYLFNRYYANGCEPFIATMKQIKEFIGIATSTTSNNLIVSDTIDILKRLGLLDYEVIVDDNKTLLRFRWMRNELPK